MAQSLSYDIQGAGPGLLLVHGVGGSAAVWAPIIPLLAKQFTVVAVDLPGSGKSSLPDGPLDQDTVADQVVAAAQQAGLNRFVVVGFSLGGPLAVRIATRNPDRVTGLVTLGGYASATPGVKLRFDLWNSLYEKDDQVSFLLRLLLFSDQYLNSIGDEKSAQLGQAWATGLPAGILAQIDLGKRADVRDDLTRVTVPTLVIALSADAFIDPTVSRAMYYGIAGAELVEINAGHLVQMERPDELAAVLASFARR